MFRSVTFRTGNNNLLYSQQCINEGLCFVNDILKDDGNFMSFDDIQNTSSVDFVTFEGIILSVKNAMRKNSLEKENYRLEEDFLSSALSIICRSTSQNKLVYYTLNDTNFVQPSACMKWERELSIPSDQWLDIFERPFIITKDTNLIWLQYRLLHRILCTNVLLVKMHIAENELCSFCKLETETFHHLFWECTYVRRVWIELLNVIRVKCHSYEHIEFDFKSIIFGSKHFDQSINFIILVMKQCVYKSKLKGRPPLYANFKTMLHFHYKIEQSIAFRRNKQNMFRLKWDVIYPIIVD